MSNDLIIYAHRGYSGRYPENTMAAFKAAYETDAQGIELDVQLTKDGEVVIIHDEKIDRTTNGTGYVKDYTYEELSKFDAGSWFDPSFTNERIPRLESFLKWVTEQDKPMMINLELKTDLFDYQGIEQKVLTLNEKAGLKQRIIISSFNFDTLKRVRELDKDIAIGVLFEGIDEEKIGQARSIHAEALHCDQSFALSKSGVEAIEQGLNLRVYTVNNHEDFGPLQTANVQIVMTDYPEKQS
ncbi:glycerophosphodiester phosphodiesterase [Priestia koreensis]|uniref:glycerophosphodiester phosphodiesterase n=1 Tax=Priestia koreensis TaxID=284581 RepID=UPI0028F6C735|nr:glycerophosphodiester phosphodiesterase [Priestia koreensis]